MFIQAFPSGPLSTNAYVVACTKTGEAAIVDPASNSFPAIEEYLRLKQLTPTKVLLTHSHWDHIADVAKFKEAYHIPVYVHPLDAPNLEHPGADQLPCWIHIPPITPDTLVEEGMSIPVGELTFQVISTPGHSQGSVCYYEPNEHVLLSGDTLFQGTIGNLSFPTSRPALMWSSLEKLSHLPAATIVYPGHGPETTIGKEAQMLTHAKDLFE